MLPLVAGLEGLTLPAPRAETSPDDGDFRLEITSVSPQAMTRLMEEGMIDLGMIPTGALMDHPDWLIVGESMIGSEGPVRSVLALGEGPSESWSRIRPDPQSRTSNLLVQIILRRQFGAYVRLGEALPDHPHWQPPDRPKPGEAVVLIGTRALRWGQRWRESGGVVLDLGEAWTKWKKLPFVYAAWVVRPDLDAYGARLEEWLEAMEKLKKKNLDRLDELLARWPLHSQEKITLEEARAYLTHHIRFELGAREREGLATFLNEARALMADSSAIDDDEVSPVQ
jgi:chorismate dehydratase